MLMSLPNSAGIDPASAYEDAFKASHRLLLPHQVESANRTCQLVVVEIEVFQVHQLAEFRGDRPCQRKRRRF